MYAHVNSSVVEDQGFCTSVDKDCLVLNETSGVYTVTSFTASAAPSATVPTN